MAYEYSRLFGSLWLGPRSAGTAGNTVAIDSAFLFETSGDAFFAQFVSPITQSSATLTFYAYVMAVTGTPDFQLHVRKAAQGSGDVDRPETAGSSISSSPSTLTLGAGDVGTWVSLTCTVSLTAGETYFAIIGNTHATPASNHATFRYRSTMGAFGAAGYDLWNEACLAGYTSSGFTTDPTVTSVGPGTFVLKFSDGTLLGFPYVDSAGHANNTDDRGIRFTPTEDVVISGLGFGYLLGAVTEDLSIYTSAGAVVLDVPIDTSPMYSVGSNHSFLRFAPITLSGGTSYDIVERSTTSRGSGTLYTMGEIEANVPADVLACRPPFSFVGGATAGSYTADTSTIFRVGLLVDNLPAISGGGAGWGNKRGNKQ